jgi:LysM repeat protein
MKNAENLVKDIKISKTPKDKTYQKFGMAPAIQERMINEAMLKAVSENKDIIRFPTPETASIIQWKKKASGTFDINNYSKKEQKILSKYEQYPETLKNLTGQEPRIVRDPNGNSWYEIDIPQGFKTGDVEIMAYQEGGSINTFRGSIYDQPIGTSRRMLKRRGGSIDSYNEDLPIYQSGAEILPEWMMNSLNSINPILPVKNTFGSMKKNVIDPVTKPLYDEQYIVKPGDNLHKIANKYKISVDDIIAVNKFDDPSLIRPNDKIRIPYIEPDAPNKTSNNSIYKVKSGDTLSEIAQANNTTVSEIVRLNKIQDKDTINVGQTIKLPEPKYKVVPDIKLSSKVYKNIDEIEKRRKEINSYTKEYKIHDGFNIVNNSVDSENFRTITMPDNERIAVEVQAIERPNDYYMVVDKTTNMLRVYKGANLVYETETILGERRSDAMTNAVAKDINGDGIITNADKVKGKFVTDWSLGNKSTGAGVFTVSSVNKTSEYDGAPSITLANENGQDISTSIHLGTTWRESKLGNKFTGDNRMSNGCINCTRGALEILSSMNFPKGTKVYILPEEPGNRYEYVDGQVAMRSSAKSRKNALSYDKEVTDEYGNKKIISVENKRGIAYNQNTLKYEPIKIEFDKKSFEKEVYQTFDFNDEEEYERVVVPYIKALENNKQKIMKVMQVSSDAYNQIAKVSFGILGNESNFGDTHSLPGNAVRGVRKWWNPEDNSGPDYIAESDWSKTSNDRSIGLTQFRWIWVEKDAEQGGDLKERLADLGIKSNLDFMDPTKAAIATTAVLAYYYNNRKVDDIMNDLPKHYAGVTENDPNRLLYTKNVKKNAKYLKIYQKSRLQRGGEVKSFNYQQPFIGATYTLPYDIF